MKRNLWSAGAALWLALTVMALGCSQKTSSSDYRAEYSAAHAFLQKGEYDSARVYFERALKSAEKAHADTVVLDVSLGLGYTHITLGDTALGVATIQRALDRAAQVFGDTSVLYAGVATQTAVNFARAGMLEDADTLVGRAIQAWTDVPGKEANLAGAWFTRGMIREMQADYEAALVAFKKAQAIYQNAENATEENRTLLEQKIQELESRLQGSPQG